MDQNTMNKLAAYFTEAELQEIAGMNKTASQEDSTDYTMGEVAAISYHETMNKLASENQLVKQAAQYVELGRQAAINDFYKQAGTAGNLAEAGVGLAQGVGRNAKRVAGDVADAASGSAKGLYNAAGESANQLYEAGKGYVGQAGDAISGAASDAYSAAGAGLEAGKGYAGDAYGALGDAASYMAGAPGRLMDTAGNLGERAQLLGHIANTNKGGLSAGLARVAPGAAGTMLGGLPSAGRLAGDLAITGAGVGAAGMGANAAYNAAMGKQAADQNKRNIIKMMILNGQI